MRTAVLALAACAAPCAAQRHVDLRPLYDVQAYRLDLRVEPETKQLSGTVVVVATVTGDRLGTVQLDMQRGLTAKRCLIVSDTVGSKSALAGRPLDFVHEAATLRVSLPEALAKGRTFRVAVEYVGSPRARGFSGFHWAETASGEPWIGTSCQGPGAHSWWPCKASFFHPEDKPERIFVNLDVPRGLYAVSNGRLVSREKNGGREVFRWVHPYPLETYSVTLNVAPYVVVEQALDLEGIDEPVPFIYYVLPENVAKAKVQFAQVPAMLRAYGKAFGPFPFPKSKFALVEASFWGMEHSTAVAYGSSYPAWCKKNGKRDRYAGRNRFFDYILVHESAHEWWGNAVSAKAWGHFWIHEGFGTYAEGVYVESTQGREAADRYFKSIEPMAMAGRLYRGKDVTSGRAYSGVIYYRGAWVLNTLRHYVGNDETWWSALRDFNLSYRYKNATTEDFQAVLEKHTKRPWKRFFEQWFYGSGAPRIRGTVTAKPFSIAVSVTNRSTSKTDFDVPLDLAWRENGKPRSKRIWLPSGNTEVEIPCKSEPASVAVVGLGRVLGRHRVVVE